MIYLKACNNLLAIQSSEFVLHHDEYPADEKGQIIDENDPRINTGEYYEYGNLYVVTDKKKYVYKKVFSPFEFAVEIINYICEHVNEPNIVIDLDNLIKIREDLYLDFNGELSVE